jgi:DNA polymerase-3 subunit chi
MEIWFYHLTRQPLDRALPVLLERALARGWKAVVQATSEERVAALDTLLWTYADASFLPHGTARDGDAEMQQVFLTTEADNPNGAAVRFFIERAQLAPVLDGSGTDAYERVILMFDGNDAEELDAARAQWKLLKSQGRAPAYWQQSEEGRWERKA